MTIEQAYKFGYESWYEKGTHDACEAIAGKDGENMEKMILDKYRMHIMIPREK